MLLTLLHEIHLITSTQCDSTEGISDSLGYSNLSSPHHYKNRHAPACRHTCTQKHTDPLSFTFPFLNFVCHLPHLFRFNFSSLLHGHSEKINKKGGDFVWEMTLWVRRRLLFVLSLIESLLLFIGARQPGQQGGQSYADHIEGLHYLEASYFLFSLKGTARGSISSAKERHAREEKEEGRNTEGERGRQRGRARREGEREAQRERVWVSVGCTGTNYTCKIASLQARGGFMLTKTVRRKICVLAHIVYMCTYMHLCLCDLCVHVRYARMCVLSHPRGCVPLHRPACICKKKINAPRGSEGLILP